MYLITGNGPDIHSSLVDGFVCSTFLFFRDMVTHSSEIDRKFFLIFSRIVFFLVKGVEAHVCLKVANSLIVESRFWVSTDV